MLFDYHLEVISNPEDTEGKNLARQAQKELKDFANSLSGTPKKDEIRDPFTLFLVDAEKMTGQWVRDRIIKHSEHDETEDRGFYLFLGRSRSIDAWKDDPERAEEHGRLKDIEFYIRVFKSYELGTYVSLADFGSI